MVSVQTQFPDCHLWFFLFLLLLFLHTLWYIRLYRKWRLLWCSYGRDSGARDAAALGSKFHGAVKGMQKWIFYVKKIIFCFQQILNFFSTNESKFIKCACFFKSHNCCQWRPLWLFAPGVNKLSHATDRFWTLPNFRLPIGLHLTTGGQYHS